MKFEKKRIIEVLLCLLIVGVAIGIAFMRRSDTPLQTAAATDPADTASAVADSPDSSADSTPASAALSEKNTDASGEHMTDSENNTEASPSGKSSSDSDRDAADSEGSTKASPSGKSSSDSDRDAADSEGSTEASPSGKSSSDSDRDAADSEGSTEASPSPSSAPEPLVERFETEKTMYAVSPVNVRTGPSTDYELCGHLNAADAVTVRGTADTGWYLIFYKEQECFVSNKYLLDTPPAAPSTDTAENPQTASATETADSQAAAANASAASASQNTAAAAQQSAAQPAPTAAPARVVASTIFVGDSRFVQMHEAVGDTGVTWICENAKGYNWFVENAIPRIDNLVGSGTKILINLGVNDTGHADSYIEKVNQKAAEWTEKGAIVYYASVNPCWENPYVTNDAIISFNSKLSANLTGIYWIDSYTYLTENGYRLVDGLHYSSDTYAVIYNYLITCIQ